MTMITAVSAVSCLTYSTSDVGCGRCRISKVLLQKLNITRLGTIITVQLSTESRQFTSVCTVWPDTSNCLNDDIICIDDTVHAGDYQLDHAPWLEADCKVSTGSLI